MTKTDFLNVVQNAIKGGKRVTLHFKSDVRILLHKKWRPTGKMITLRFFEYTLNEKQIGYAYKQRINETQGYAVTYLPISEIVEVSYPDENVDYEAHRIKFKKWILRNLDQGVWPQMEDNIDSILSCLKPNEYTRFYLRTIATADQLQRVEQLFEERRGGTVNIGIKNNAFVETSQRESGFYAWLVIGEKSWTLLNPNVAILGK